MPKRPRRAWRNSDVADVEEHLDRYKRFQNTRKAITTSSINLGVGNKDGRADAHRQGKDAKRKKTTNEKTEVEHAPKFAPMVDVANISNAKANSPAEESTRSGQKPSRMKRQIKARLARKLEHKEDHRQRLENLKEAGLQSEEAITDLWEENPEKGIEKEKERNKGFEVDITPVLVRKRKYMKSRSKKEVAASRELVGPSGLKVCPAGASYNPDEALRQQALQIAFERDEKERADLASLHVKLNPSSFQIEGVVPSSDDESELIPHRRQAKMKTKAQKNTKLRMIEEAFVKDKEKKQAEMHKQIDRIGAVLGGIKKKSKQDDARRKQVQQLKETQPDHRPKTSKHEFEAPFPEVPLEDDLKDRRSLRMMAPSVHLLSDRFKSFQEKNIIEPRVKVKGLERRYKMKEFTRKSHKDERMKFGSRSNKA